MILEGTVTAYAADLANLPPKISHDSWRVVIADQPEFRVHISP